MSSNQDMDSASGALALADGTVFAGHGSGAAGIRAGELCFNTAMTGYQEILTDPSYASQIVLFTFPHIGITGTNPEDHEDSSPPAADAARGAIFREPVTDPSNWRATGRFDTWLARRGIIGLSGVDTRALTHRIREHGMPRSAICHKPGGGIDFRALVETARAWEGLEAADLARQVAALERFEHTQGLWQPRAGYTPMGNAEFHVVVIDFGVKKNILRNLASVGARTTVINGDASAADILTLRPDGIVLSNGPGDPSATIRRSGDMIQTLIATGLPILGICLGHQLLALALGAKTMKMAQGHHGANHPVKDLATGKVEIVSMNHGFTVDTATLPAGVEESHRSLFDGTNSGLSVAGKPIISVQHHPEASPGPQDSFYLFERFAGLMRTHRAK
jgi:carbamoyl-phosphate synthase small subunit